MINPKSDIRSMTNQELRAYFRETQDEAAFREILRRGLDEKDKAAGVQSVARGTICDILSAIAALVRCVSRTLGIDSRSHDTRPQDGGEISEVL